MKLREVLLWKICKIFYLVCPLRGLREGDLLREKSAQQHPPPSSPPLPTYGVGSATGRGISQISAEGGGVWSGFWAPGGGGNKFRLPEGKGENKRQERKIFLI